jgi:hypothetical protein
MDYQKFRYVNYLWDDTVASTLDPVGRLVYRSNILGSDLALTSASPILAAGIPRPKSSKRTL